MIEDAAKPLHSNIALPDVLVPVHAGAQWRFGVVGVDYHDAAEPEYTAGGAHSLLQAGGVGHIVACGQRVRGVQAVADAEARAAGGGAADLGEFLEAAADGGAAANGVFQKQHEAVARKSGRGFVE